MEFDQVVNEILKTLFKGGSLPIADEASDHYDLDYHDAYRVADILESEDLAVYIAADRVFMKITEKGREAFENGGYIKYKERKRDEERKAREERDLQVELAKSNIEANKLNKEIAERNEIERRSIRDERRINKISLAINAVLGAFNIGLLIWQML